MSKNLTHGVRPMAECHRCGTETSRRTLEDEPLCESRDEWREEHQQSREADQHSLGEWDS